jgi:SWI/SNF-related matrix-associated actin-dependent regulator 1 of chromatin subfamily A
LPKADIYLAHYDLLPARKTAGGGEAPGRAPDLLRTGFRTLILDEAQALRHRDTGRFRALRDLIRDARPENVLALSGTPLYNHGHEFWPILNAVRPDLVGTFARFTSDWCWKLRADNYMIRQPREFADMLAREVMLRRTKSEVAPQLPAKRRLTQAVEVDQAQYDAEMRAIAAQYYSAASLSLAQRQARSMAALSKERCISGLLKVPAVADWVAEMLDADPERQVLLFAHHAGVIEGYMRKLSRFNPVRYTGLDNADDRAEALAEFKAGRSRVFIASLRVAGLGLNLQCANTVVFAEYDWSPAVHQQAEDRCHRIGQEREVTSYFAFAPSTLDGYILDLCNSKEEEIGAVLGAAEAAGSERMALQAVAELERRLGVTGGKAEFVA